MVREGFNISSVVLKHENMKLKYVFYQQLTRIEQIRSFKTIIFYYSVMKIIHIV